jgi:hypothetical protein
MDAPPRTRCGRPIFSLPQDRRMPRRKSSYGTVSPILTLSYALAVNAFPSISDFWIHNANATNTKYITSTRTLSFVNICLQIVPSCLGYPAIRRSWQRRYGDHRAGPSTSHFPTLHHRPYISIFLPLPFRKPYPIYQKFLTLDPPQLVQSTLSPSGPHHAPPQKKTH